MKTGHSCFPFTLVFSFHFVFFFLFSYKREREREREREKFLLFIFIGKYTHTLLSQNNNNNNTHTLHGIKNCHISVITHCCQYPYLKGKWRFHLGCRLLARIQVFFIFLREKFKTNLM